MRSLLASSVAGGFSLLEAVTLAACVAFTEEDADPGGYYPAGFRLALTRRLTLDHSSHISKVRSSSKPSHVRARLSVKAIQPGRINFCDVVWIQRVE
jgi:hypothetical protein